MVQDKIRGSLIGGAIGDALGCPVEFCNHKEIMQRYGKDGITRFDLKPHWMHEEKWTGKALVSDDIHMTIIGSGEKDYINAWRQKANKPIEKGTLTYIEKLSQSELRAFYKKSDIMVFPSFYEIFGMVLLEAMYFDLPVISSDNGGSDTLITDGFDGVIVKSFDADTWCESISKLHDDTEMYKIIKNNLILKDHAVYTWDGIARRYIDTIKDL